MMLADIFGPAWAFPVFSLVFVLVAVVGLYAFNSWAAKRDQSDRQMIAAMEAELKAQRPKRGVMLSNLQSALGAGKRVDKKVNHYRGRRRFGVPKPKSMP